MKILWLGIYSGIWPHSILEAQLLGPLERDPRFELFYLKCEKQLQRLCNTRQYYGLTGNESPARMLEVCNYCKRCDSTIERTLGNDALSLNSYLSATEVSQSYNISREIPEDKLNEFVFKDIEIGKYSLYDSTIKFKKNNKKYENNEAEFFRNTIQNSILMATAAEKIIKDVRPDIVIGTDLEYSAMRSFASIASRNNIQVFRISGSPAVSEKNKSVRIWQWDKHKSLDPAIGKWETRGQFEDRIDEARLEKLLLAIKVANSPWTYSAAARGKSSRKEFQIPSANGIMLAVMNSTDEYLAAVSSDNFPKSKLSQNVFKDQREWITNLIEFTRKIPNLTLIVRPHPRDYANKREGLNSHQSQIWEEYFVNLPDNVVLDHPNLNFPLPDYWKEIKVLTTGWSSTALEAVIEGVPAVSYDSKILLYPSELITVGDSVNEYHQNLLNALDRNISYHERRNIRSWIWYSNFKGSISLKGGIMEIEVLKRYKLLRILFLILNKYFKKTVRTIEINRKIEDAEISRILDFFLSGSDTVYELDD